MEWPMAMAPADDHDQPHHQSSILSLTFSELQRHESLNFSSMNIEYLLNNIFSDTNTFPPAIADTGSSPRQESFSVPENLGSKTVNEVWKEIVMASGGSLEPDMTLQDFLIKVGAVRREGVRSPVILSPPAGYGADSTINDSSQFQHTTCMQSPKSRMGGLCVESVRFGEGTDAGGGKGKKRVGEELPGAMVLERKQLRMIKNRESAARSRVRNKAHTVELESLVKRLEEENATLLREEAKQKKERIKLITVQNPGIATQLETLIGSEEPVDEKFISMGQTLETNEVGISDDELVDLPIASLSAQAESRNPSAFGGEEDYKNDRDFADEKFISMDQTLETNEVGISDDELVDLPIASLSAQAESRNPSAFGGEEDYKNDRDFAESYNPGNSPSPDNIFVATYPHENSKVSRMAPTVATQENNATGLVNQPLGQSNKEVGAQELEPPSQPLVDQNSIVNELANWEEILQASTSQPVESIPRSPSKLHHLLRGTDLRPELIEVLRVYDQSHPEMLAGHVHIDTPSIRGYILTALGEVLLKFQGFTLSQLVPQVIDEFQAIIRDLKHTGVDLSWMSLQFDKIESTLAAPEVVAFLEEDRAVINMAESVQLAREQLHKILVDLAQAQERKMKALEVVRSFHGEEAIQMLKDLLRGSI